MARAKNGKPTPAELARVDKLVAQFVAIRDRIKAIEAAHEVELGPFIQAKKDLGTEILAFLDGTGQESARTAYGTASVTVRHTASCSDPDAFVDFVRQNDLYELMDRKANAPACRDYAKEHGTLPPGVRINSIRIVGVTTSGVSHDE